MLTQKFPLSWFCFCLFPLKWTLYATTRIRTYSSAQKHATVPGILTDTAQTLSQMGQNKYRFAWYYLVYRKIKKETCGTRPHLRLGPPIACRPPYATQEHLLLIVITSKRKERLGEQRRATDRPPSRGEVGPACRWTVGPIGATRNNEGEPPADFEA